MSSPPNLSPVIQAAACIADILDACNRPTASLPERRKVYDMLKRAGDEVLDASMREVDRLYQAGASWGDITPLFFSRPSTRADRINLQQRHAQWLKKQADAGDDPTSNSEED